MGRFSRLETDHKPEGHGDESTDVALRDVLSDLPPRPDPDGKDSKIDPAEMVEHGNQAFFRGAFKEALRWYSRAIDHDSTVTQPWVALIRTLLFKGDLREAGTWINRGLTLAPNSPHLMAMRAVLYAHRGMLRQAINNSDRVLEEHGNEPLAHMARGEVLLLADNKHADFCFQQSLKLAPSTDWMGPMLIGLIYEKRRQWAKAIQYYAKAAENNERLAVLWYRVGISRAAMGHTQHARRALDQARELCDADDPLLSKIYHARPGSIWRRLRHLFSRR
jgi:tetratricopeptide (TPR) repeat protein